MNQEIKVIITVFACFIFTVISIMFVHRETRRSAEEKALLNQQYYKTPYETCVLDVGGVRGEKKAEVYEACKLLKES